MAGSLPFGQMAKGTTGDDFRELLRALVQRYGSREALGKTIGMSGSRVGRAIDGQYSFNIENCLKLADATGESPSVILRAAGKTSVAELIERLYGSSRPGLKSHERELLAAWESVSPRAREVMRALLADLLPKATAKHKKSA